MNLYFMGIGGVAMGNAALLARQLGHRVFGTDGPLYPPMSTALADLEITLGYDATRLSKLISSQKIDAVIIGNNLGRGNAEVEYMWSHRPCEILSLPEFLQKFVLRNRLTVAACGTHGKTTTTTLTAYLLEKNNAHPGWLIGGVPHDLPSGANAGDKSSPFIIEGDEYDSAFFDKRAKFISYQPTIAILNNLEPDHLDIYRDIDDLKRAFNHLQRTVPAHGLIIANADDANLRSMPPVSWVTTLWVSAEDHPFAQLHIKNYQESPTGASFDLYFHGQLWQNISWPLGGLFNARNAAMASLAAAATLHLSQSLLSGSQRDASLWRDFKGSALKVDLSSFHGVKRRQELRHTSPSLVVIEDFAHHPTAVALTLTSLRARFPGRRWVACLEPRSNTTRTNAHQSTFPAAMALADISIFGPVHGADKMPADKRLDTSRLARDIAALGKVSHFTSSCNDIPALLESITADGQPTGIVFFSNGTFEGVMDTYLASLSAVHA